MSFIINPYRFTPAVNPVFTGLTHNYNFTVDANDNKGSINGTLINGASITSGGVNGVNALSLDGATQYVGFPKNSFALTGDFSIETWVYITANNFCVIFSNSYIDVSSHYVGYKIFYDGAGAFYGWVADGSSTSVISDNSLSGSIINHWVQVVWTFKSSNKEAKLYTNGSLKTTTTLSINPTYDSSTNSIIGADDIYGNPTKYYYMQGKMNYTRIWDGTILTAGNVTTLYNSGNGLAY
jgi:hypothetical protein